MTSLTTVRLYIYDISHGLAGAYGAALLGKPIDGVWHTGVGVYGREYLFGSSGVSYTAPEEIYRQGLAPKPKAKDLGQTKRSLAEIQAWIYEKSSSSFLGIRYDLLDWNCNNFSDEFTKYLLDSSKSLIPEEILELPRFVKTTPLGRMLMSFLNKDPISIAQQTGNHNNNFTDSSIHMVPTKAATNESRLDQIPARKCILPMMDKMKARVSLIEPMCQTPLNQHQKELLNDIQQLFQPNASSSPLLTVEHIKILISLMINSIQDESGQRNILEILQLLSEYEFVIRLINNLKGDESPIELLKGLHEQPESIQIEFLRWFSAIAATSDGRTMLVDVQDNFTPVFTEYLLNDSLPRKVKYEIIVVLHNLLCINTDIRLSFMNSLSLGSAVVQVMNMGLNDHEADTFLAVFIALADVEHDLYGIAKAMDFNPDLYSSIVACEPMIAKIKHTFETV